MAMAARLKWATDERVRVVLFAILLSALVVGGALWAREAGLLLVVSRV